MKCIVCDQKVNSSDILLLNAKGVHDNCFKEIKSNDTPEDETIQNLEIILRNWREKSINLNSLYNRIFNSKRNDEKSECEKRILKIKSQIDRSKMSKMNTLACREEMLSAIYSLWLERPPDWEQRREDVLDWQNYCNSCGALESLHIHHKRQLKDGGTHKLENLEVLCEDCHSDAHGGIKFRYNKKERETAYSKHYKILQKAIENKRPLMLNYEKYNGEKSQRVIYPKLFERWGESLIVGTHCELRNDKRNFNLIRIKKLKPIKQIP